MRLILIETGGVVGQQYLGPVDTDSLSDADAGRIRAAVDRVDFDAVQPEPSNVPMRTLRVTDNEETRSVSWRGPTEWGREINDALDAVADWQVGTPPEL
jgi:hypothetical protein